MNNSDAEKINQAALELLDEGDFYQAQDLLRKNAKKHPAHMTLHNLGVFYLVEGMELSGGRMRGAEKLGLRYLKAAQAYGQSLQNLMVAGGYYFKQKDFDTAAAHYKAAVELGGSAAPGGSFEACNNLGACLYLLGDPAGALKCFDRALGLCDNSEDRATILVSYGFSLLPADRKRSLDLLNSERLSLPLYLPDEFALLYLCGDLQSAALNVMRLINEYAVDPTVVAMIFDCLFRLGKSDEVRTILELVLDGLKGFGYDMTFEIDCIRRAYGSAEIRAELIKEFRYHPPVISPNGYIGRMKPPASPDARAMPPDSE